MRITVRGCAKSRAKAELRFEGICERRVYLAPGGGNDQLAMARLRRGAVQCQRGGQIRPGSECFRCPRLVNLYPHGAQVRIRCLWTDEDPVSSLMTLTPALVRLPSDTPVSHAQSVLEASLVDFLLVVDDGQLVGVVGKRELSGDGPGNTLRYRVDHCPWVIADTASLAEAAALMLAKDLGCLPVVRGHELRGMLTVADLRKVGVELSELAVA
jgi:CBS domain-containing protein